MMEWITYLLKVSACTGIFYACYYIFFKKLTFFSFNRYSLLIILTLSFVIPAMQIAINRSGQVDETTGNYHTLLINDRSSAKKQSAILTTKRSSISPVNWTIAIFILYWAVAFALIIFFLFRLFRLLLLTMKPYKRSGHLKLIYTPEKLSNCSFLNYVFLDKRGMTPTEISVVLKHESIHSARLHSIDRLILTISKAVLWFNPVIYLLDRSLEQVHEFEADQLASSLVGTRDYAHLLLNMAIRKNSTNLVHSFAKNPVKIRIKMLFADPSKQFRKATYLTLVPVCCILIWIFGIKYVYAGPTHVEFGNHDKSELLGPDIDSCFAMFPLESKVRLIGWNSAANPNVSIDGKKCNADILTRISPRCVKIAGVSYNDITLTTYHRKIEFATKTDIENANEMIKAEKTGKPYLRYTLKNEKGKTFDLVQVLAGPCGIGIFIPSNKKVLIILNGKKYSEEEAKKFDESVIKPGSTIKELSTFLDIAATYPQYAQEYGAIIQISKAD